MHGFQLWVNLPARQDGAALLPGDPALEHPQRFHARRPGQGKGHRRRGARRARPDRDANPDQVAALALPGGRCARRPTPPRARGVRLRLRRLRRRRRTHPSGGAVRRAGRWRHRPVRGERPGAGPTVLGRPSRRARRSVRTVRDEHGARDRTGHPRVPGRQARGDRPHVARTESRPRSRSGSRGSAPGPYQGVVPVEAEIALAAGRLRTRREQEGRQSEQW